MSCAPWCCLCNVYPITVDKVLGHVVFAFHLGVHVSAIDVFESEICVYVLELV